MMALENSLMLVVLWLDFPLADGQVKGSSAIDGCFEKGKAVLWIDGYADFSSLCLILLSCSNLVAG